MKTVIKSLIITGLLLASCTTLRAQHEWSFHAFGGLHTLQHQLTGNGTNKGNFGGGGGIGYNYHLNNHWSTGAGIDAACYSTSIQFGRLSDSYTGFDRIENTDFIYTAHITGFNETATVWMLEIPLAMRYAILPHRNETNLHFTGGIKFGLPLHTKYAASANQLQTTGKYAAENQEYHDIPGIFTSEPMDEHTGTFDAKPSIQLMLEIAYRLMTGENSGLSIGVYFHYGLNDIQSKTDIHPVAFDINGNQPYTSNSLLHSPVISSIRPVAFGVKVQFDLTTQQQNKDKHYF